MEYAEKFKGSAHHYLMLTNAPNTYVTSEQLPHLMLTNAKSQLQCALLRYYAADVRHVRKDSQQRRKCSSSNSRDIQIKDGIWRAPKVLYFIPGSERK